MDQRGIVGPSTHGRARRVRLAVTIVALGILISQWVRVVVKTNPYDDFRLHWNFARRFVAGQDLYGGGNLPYPPFWGMANAPMTLMPPRIAHLALLPLGAAALVVLTSALHCVSRRHLPLDRDRLFWATAAALALSSRFLIRDLPECGPNIAMVALSWAGLALWGNGRARAGGACLGLAMALKCTPALFVPYLALKRQWRMAAWAVATSAILTLAPMAWQGPTSFARHFRQWAGNCWNGLGRLDPSIGVLGQEEVWNVSLRPTIARLLMRLPPGHKGRIDSPWRAQVLDLSPRVAGALIKSTLFLLLAGMAWTFRHPARDRDDGAVPWEGAAVSLVILLDSPLTWKQHCVGAYPACYLIARAMAARWALPRWAIGALCGYVVLVLLLDRGVVGRSMTLLLDSWGVITWSLLLLLAVTLACRSRQVAAIREASRGGAVPPPHFAEARTPRLLRGAFLRWSRITGRQSSR